MLELSPWDIRQLVVMGIQRWQMRRITTHLPEHEGEVLGGQGHETEHQEQGTCMGWQGNWCPNLFVGRRKLAERTQVPEGLS